MNLKNNLIKLYKQIGPKYSVAILLFLLTLIVPFIVGQKNDTDFVEQILVEESFSPKDSAMVQDILSMFTDVADLKIAPKGDTKDLYKVTRVVDGDTIIVHINGESQRLRLIGIDTPETVKPNSPVECYGLEASKKMKSLVLNKKVYLESDASQQNTDQYDRLLRYVFLEDNTNILELMIKEGYAEEKTYNGPYKYQSLFKQAELEAKKQNKGLWNCVK